jgi:hypothetical protein
VVCTNSNWAKHRLIEEPFEETSYPISRSKYYETELCGPCDRFSPAVRIELGENRGDRKLGSMEGDF